jgi:hypothetical protein
MNWGEIKTAVKNYLENEEVTFLSNFPLYARLAEEDIYRKLQLQATKDTARTELMAGDYILSTPDDMISVYSLAVTSPEFSFLLPKDISFLREAYPDPNMVNVPRFYAFRDEKNLLLAPTPDDSYTVEMHYYKKLPSIGAGDNPANTNWLSENGENALIFGVIYHGYIYEKGDQDVIAAYSKQFESAIADLKLIVEGRQQKDTYRTPDQRVPV